MTLMHENLQDLVRRREFPAARRIAQELISENPLSSDAHYWLGVISQFEGRIGQAAEYLKRALDLDPKNTDAAICLSVLYNDVGSYDKAKEIFQVANQSVLTREDAVTNEVDRKFASKHLELADLYFRYRRYDEAIEEYTKAMALDPLDMQVPIRRARTFAKKGFVSRAIQELQRLRDDYPDSIEPRLQLGLLYFSQNNVLDAEIEWEAILKKHPDHFEAKKYLEMAASVRVGHA